jgi:hypothetical protein
MGNENIESRWSGCRSLADARFSKIGISQNIPVRLYEFATSSPDIVTLVHYEIGTHASEKAFHKRFAADHERGEWFKLSDDIVAYIREARSRTPVQNAEATKFRMEKGAGNLIASSSGYGWRRNTDRTRLQPSSLQTGNFTGKLTI